MPSVVSYLLCGVLLYLRVLETHFAPRLLSSFQRFVCFHLACSPARASSLSSLSHIHSLTLDEYGFQPNSRESTRNIYTTTSNIVREFARDATGRMKIFSKMERRCQDLPPVNSPREKRTGYPPPIFPSRPNLLIFMYMFLPDARMCYAIVYFY